MVTSESDLSPEARPSITPPIGLVSVPIAKLLKPNSSTTSLPAAAATAAASQPDPALTRWNQLPPPVLTGAQPCSSWWSGAGAEWRRHICGAWHQSSSGQQSLPSLTEPPNAGRKQEVPQGVRHGPQGSMVHPVQVEEGLQSLRGLIQVQKATPIGISVSVSVCCCNVPVVSGCGIQSSPLQSPSPR